MGFAYQDNRLLKMRTERKVQSRNWPICRWNCVCKARYNQLTSGCLVWSPTYRPEPWTRSQWPIQSEHHHRSSPALPVSRLRASSPPLPLARLTNRIFEQLWGLTESGEVVPATWLSFETSISRLTREMWIFPNITFVLKATRRAFPLCAHCVKCTFGMCRALLLNTIGDINAEDATT